MLVVLKDHVDAVGSKQLDINERAGGIAVVKNVGVVCPADLDNTVVLVRSLDVQVR